MSYSLAPLTDEQLEADERADLVPTEDIEQLEYVRPPVYQKQYNAFWSDDRISMIEGSTKSGKTFGSMAWLLEQTLLRAGRGENTLWVAPIYPQAEIAYTRFVNGLPKNVFQKNDGKLRLRFGNGATMFFKGGDNPDSIYGEDYKATIIDEASRTHDKLFEAVRSTVTATRGPIRCIGNVRGRQNWHYRMCRKAEAKAPGMNYYKLIAQDAVDGGVLDPQDLIEARQDLIERVYQELYECIPSDDGGNPFGLTNIGLRKKLLSTLPPVAFGVDLAKSVDWTVVIGLDVNGDVCRFERWQSPWLDTIARIKSIVGNVACLVDSTGVGDPIVEALQKGSSNYLGYKFTQPSKQQLMEGLALAIQQNMIGYPDGVIVLELEAFEYQYVARGVRYSAPDGYHDDCVVALALAQARRMLPIEGQGVLDYYATLFGKKLEAKSEGGTPWH